MKWVSRVDMVGLMPSRREGVSTAVATNELETVGLIPQSLVRGHYSNSNPLL
jgi:hypothetical protein